MSADKTIDYEHYPAGVTMDEADVSLRYHFAQMSDERLREYDASWGDDRVLEWEPDFRNDGGLMLVCVERDVDMEEYRRVLEEQLGPDALV